MCHPSETQHYFDDKPLYERAQDDQNIQWCSSASYAKFWREAQEKPIDWLVGYDERRGHYVARLPHRA